MIRRVGSRLPVEVLSLTVFMAVAALGCTHTRTLTPESPEPFRRLNEVAAGWDGVVELVDGTRLPARALRADRDSVLWINPETELVVQVPLREVFAVRFLRRGRGSLEGATFGVPIGTGIGAALGFSFCDIPDVDTGACKPVVTAGMGAVGGLVGAAVGALIRSKEVFRFPPTTDTETPTDEQPRLVSR